MKSLGSYLTRAAPRLSVVLALTFAGQASIGTAVATPAVAAALARCRDSQLTVTATELAGAAVSGGAVVRYRDLGQHACTLSGYPTVVGLVSRAGPAQAAVDVVSAALGGWQPYRLGVTEPLPTVVLLANGGMASSVVEFVSTGSAQSPCPSGRLPLWFRSVWLDVPGGTRPFALDVSSMAITMIVCSHFVTTPIVPGTTGSALQVPPLVSQSGLTAGRCFRPRSARTGRVTGLLAPP